MNVAKLDQERSRHVEGSDLLVDTLYFGKRPLG